MPQRTAGRAIHFDATLFTIDGSTLRLSEKASVKLPSRGQVAVKGVIDGMLSKRFWNRTAVSAIG